ncbi:hypothetical protein ACYA5O_02095 [Klebsiella pneumoniae]|uniref:hypothetical protein n=1 Tax=Klebsiella pneumoniae TaxID=573 RepID=UPI000E3B913F|nr:hypothetical protein [Klebsiella pneumoniae]MBC4676301.1 hypothetical protein [Klebsiella pneumoniae]MBX4492386.1 hypothetical protein [Klebsiella pneumoniae]MBX4494570.1 hypothetical protein [Klebsiella pneumoniae]MBX4681657.1 hypothetical protein [Klebsiella pneumoniae]MBZ1994387.1 hypothetical protein [Klebsiella pneumoniae]
MNPEHLYELNEKVIAELTALSSSALSTLTDYCNQHQQIRCKLKTLKQAIRSSRSGEQVKVLNTLVKQAHQELIEVKQNVKQARDIYNHHRLIIVLLRNSNLYIKDH